MSTYIYDVNPDGTKVYYGTQYNPNGERVTDPAVLGELQAGTVAAVPRAASTRTQADVDAYQASLSASATATGGATQAPAGTTTVNGTPYAAGQTPAAPASTQASTPITSASLTPPPPIPYQSPDAPPAYPVATLGSPTPGVDPATGQMTLTPTEQQGQDYTTKLIDLNNQLTGQSAYRAEQENAAGLTDLKKTQSDLTAQLNALKNEAMAIPLQAQNQAEGRGVTAGGLRPIEAAATRNNAIQALTINSLLEATNGNISTALMMVDRAVAQKYDPIKEQIEVAQRNLELIMNSPQASIEDKNRAMAQKAIQDAKADQLAQEQENWKNIQKIAVDAAAGGADALTLNKIQNAKSPTEAASLAAAAGIYKTADQDAVQQIAVEAAAGGADAATLQRIQAAKNPVEAAQIASAAGIYTKAGAQAEEQFTLGKDQVRYDAQGNVIAQGVSSSEVVEPPKQLTASEIKTYQDLGYQVQPGMTQADVANVPYSPPADPNANKQIGSTEAKRLTDMGYTGITPTMTEAEMTAAVNSQIKPAAPSGYPTVNLAPGSTDSANVTKLQNWLVANGYMTQAEMNTGPGIYGPKTTAAVAKVQSQYGVDNTGAVGYWGPKTQAALAGGAPTPVAKTTSTASTSSGSTEYYFNPTAGDKSKVQQYAAANPSAGIDTQKIKTDEGYFYWVLSQANSSSGRSE